MPIHVCENEECKKIFEDKKKVKEIEEKKEEYYCIHYYEKIKSKINNIKYNPNKKIREANNI